MLPIFSLSSFVHSLISNSFCSISSSFSQIISKVLLFLVCSSFHCLQFLSNLPQYSSLYCLSNYLNSFFVVNCPGSSSLLNVLSFFFAVLHLLCSIGTSFQILQLLPLYSPSFLFLSKYLTLS